MSSIFDWVQIGSVLDNNDADSQINWLEGQAPSTVNDSARAMMARLAFLVKAIGGALTYGGSSSAYTITTNETHTNYVDGEFYLFIANHTSATSCTIQKDGIATPKKLYLPDGTTQAGSGHIVSGYAYLIRYEASADGGTGGFVIVGVTDGQQFTTIELGHASDTTLSRSAAGRLAVEGVDVALLTATQTLTNKTLTSPTINGGTVSSVTAITVSGGSNNEPIVINNTTGGFNVISFLDSSVREAYIGLNSSNLDIQHEVSGGAVRLLTHGGSCTLVLDDDGTLDVTGTTTTTIAGHADIGTIDARVATSSETSGTLTAASANRVVNASGDITINDGVFTAGDWVTVYAGASARSIVQDTGMTLRLGGTATTGTRTLAVRGVANIYFVSNSEAVVSGAVT